MKKLFTKLRLLSLSALLLFATAAFCQEGTVSVKMSGLDGSGKYYGKVNIPKGKKYKVVCEPNSSTVIRVYSARIDGTNLYLTVVDHFMGAHWIDATETSHNFIVRSTTADDVKFVPVTDAEDQIIENDEDYYYYDKADARRNVLKYTETKVPNDTLRSSATYKNKNIYVMASPAKYGLAFMLFNPMTRENDLAAKSLYVVSKSSSASRLNVIFDDADLSETTGLSEMKDVQYVSPNTYNLNGQRVRQATKGLYIMNGKKVYKR